jgi:L-lactate dehydrogenase (cytochrome)
VLSGADAKIANAAGLDGIIVSNHGGRQLDTAVPPLKVLPEIVVEKGAMSILFDSGIRRGTDVVNAINLLAGEVDRNVALLGCTSLEELGSRLI